MAKVVDTMYFIRPAPTEFFSSNVGTTRSQQLANRAGTVGLAGITSASADGIEGLGDAIQADPLTWSASTFYAAGSTVRSPFGGLGNVYVALVNATSNTGKDPDAEQRIKENPFAVQTETPFWQIVRKTTNDAFNDGRPNISVGRRDVLTVQMTTVDDIDTIALMNIRAASVSYAFTRAGSVETETFELSNIDNIDNWDEYLYTASDFARNHIFRNVPRAAHPSSTRSADKLTITLRNPGGVASIGQVVLGNEEQIGEVDGDSVNIDTLDFSEVERDDFGQLTTTRRDAVPTVKFRTIFDRDLTSFVQELFHEYRGGRPAVFFLTPNSFFGTVVYGFLARREVSFVADSNDLSEAFVTVEGLA